MSECTCPKSDTLSRHLHGCPVPEDYNGWTNRETWAVALHVNNDQGWQESVHEALREARDRNEADYEANPESHDPEYRAMGPTIAGDIIRENVETLLDPDQYRDEFGDQQPEALARISHEIGSLWRVNWTELGESFLRDLEEG